jgi:peptidoglycan/LPS O-acetylase OafA/YrhL
LRQFADSACAEPDLLQPLKLVSKALSANSDLVAILSICFGRPYAAVYCRLRGTEVGESKIMKEQLVAQAGLENKDRWRADIDGLRAVAVLSVLCFHAYPEVFPGGFIGVDVFFVISGFLITKILLNDHRLKRWSIVCFYERRARRIFPALSVVLICTLAATWLFAYPESVRTTAKHAIAGSLSAENIALWKESGYFDLASSLKPLLHIWSLGVEEQFYVFWPLMVAFLVRKSLPIGRVTLFICIASLAAACFARTDQNTVFYLPFFRAWELGLGALVAVAVDKAWHVDRFFSARLADLLQVGGLISILFFVIIIDYRAPLPSIASFLPVLGASLIIWAGAHRDGIGRFTGFLLGNKVFVAVGGLSYSLYLWHWPLLSIPLAAGIELTAVWKFILLIGAVLLSALSLKWIETPARQSKMPYQATLLSVAALALAAALSVGVYVTERMHAPAVAEAMPALAWPGPGRVDTCPEGARDINPKLSYCAVAQPSAAAGAVIWGDSHADHLFPGLAALDGRRNWMLLGNPSCPPIVGVDVNTDQPLCRERAEQALTWIVAQKPVKTVVISFFGGYFEDSDRAYQHTHGPVGPSKVSIGGNYDAGKKTEAFADGLDASIKRLIAADKQVALLIDIPEIPFDPSKCFAEPRLRLATYECKLSIENVLQRQSRLRSLIAIIAERYPSVVVVDLTRHLCTESMCNVGTKNEPIYRDSHHLSQYGSAIAAAAIVGSLQPVLDAD